MKHVLIEPFTKEKIREFRTGDTVFITGTIYTARDAAHARIVEMLNEGEKPPFDIKNAIVYYVGPTPARPGMPSGSAGPTTSYRMDSYTPRMLDEGMLGMIGKGRRSDEVKASISEHGAVYMAAVGGAAALIAQSIVSSEVIAFEELGTEAVRKLRVENMPVIVALDAAGRDIYDRE